jgi:dTDP-glucose 4,6-dehydratase
MYDFIVTGGRGFIGGHFIELILSKGFTVLNIDKMTYVSSQNIGFEKHPHYTEWKMDIVEITSLPKCDYLVNFAAESFVDNSIESSDIFFKSNVEGVHRILECIRIKPKFDRPIFIQISTDEVYGDNINGKFTEKDVLRPSNPYSATKAAAEQFLFAYARTYEIDFIITRCSNNYGIRQFPEKLIPKTILSALGGKKIPVHGDGTYVRSWVSAMDHCEAILELINAEVYNQIYNICSGEEYTNLEIIKMVFDGLKLEPNLLFVENRWGQDVRYSISTNKIEEAIGWKAKNRISEDINSLIKYYAESYETGS